MKLYTQMHFSTDKKLFKQYNLPNYVEHLKEHRSFIDIVSELEQKMANGNLILSFEVTNSFKKWLTERILCTDMQYSDFLISNGLK